MVMEDVDFSAVSDKQIRDATGKNWREWCTLLDKRGTEKKLVPMVNYLMKRHGLNRTHAQIVAVYYKWEKRLM